MLKGKGPTFTDKEVAHLLDVTQQHTPIGLYEWDTMEGSHLAAHPGKASTKERLKIKISLLYTTKAQNGDPCSAPLVCAKYF